MSPADPQSTPSSAGPEAAAPSSPGELQLWSDKYARAHAAGEQLFSTDPHPLVVQALDKVQILTRHRPSAIDVGAGEGRHSRELARRGYIVYAVEGVEAAVAAQVTSPPNAPTNDTASPDSDAAAAPGASSSSSFAPDASPDTAIEWFHADVYTWSPPTPVDVVLTAFFHKRHDGILDLLPRLYSWVHETGWMVLVGHSRLQAGRDVGGPPYADALWDRSALETSLRSHGFRIVFSQDIEHPGRCRDTDLSDDAAQRPGSTSTLPVTTVIVAQRDN